MKKFYSLLKAMLSQDMNIFKYKTRKNSSKLKKLLSPLLLGLLVMYAVGVYSYIIAEPLSKVGLTFVTLTIFAVIVTIITFMEGMYKSQGILFDSKDNDLLFSLPIKKSNIFALRIMKLLIFQFFYNLLFMLPSIAVYAYFERPGINFYVISLIMLILLPIIPTVAASILGYVVKGISSKFKAKKIVQTILSTFLFLGIFYLSFSLEGFITKITEKANSINEILTKIYYPAGAYINLIQKFDLVELIKLIAISIIPLIITIYLGSIYYFKIISKSSESGNNNVKVKNNKKAKVSTPLKALIKKEFSRYFSSPVYMFNTSFGIFIMLATTIALCVNSNGLIGMITTNEGMDINIETVYMYLPKIYLQLIIFVGCMTSITASSISLEGKSFNITKSLPVKTEIIFLAKILASDIITLPIMFISDFIFAIKFNLTIYEIFIMLAFTIIVPTFTALIGLIINLKYPKMEWSSEIEVVKQSLSTLISVWGGMIIFGISTALMVNFFENLNILIILELCIFTLIDGILWVILKKYGKNRFREISV